jgi:predicted transposase YbfD/YdcC
LEKRALLCRPLQGAEVDFPFAAQVARLDRWTDRGQGKIHQETVFLLTSLWPDLADAPTLLRLARAHWTIENGLHWVRDWNWDEDRSTIRHPNGARVMASLRNLAIACHRHHQCRRPKPISLASHQRHLAARQHEALRLITHPWSAARPTAKNRRA